MDFFPQSQISSFFFFLGNTIVVEEGHESWTSLLGILEDVQLNYKAFDKVNLIFVNEKNKVENAIILEH